MKQQTKDLLQAELAHTLKRRKPIQIDEPVKYEYPTYDEQRHDSSPHNTPTKPLNVSAVLSVVSNMKIGNDRLNVNDEPNTIVPTITAVKADVSGEQPNNINNNNTTGPMISHAKPNFQIERKISRTKSHDTHTSAKENIDIASKLVHQYERKFDGRIEKVPVKQVISAPIIGNTTKSELYEVNRNKWKTLEMDTSNDMKSPKLLQDAMKNADRPNGFKSKPAPLNLTTTTINKSFDATKPKTGALVITAVPIFDSNNNNHKSGDVSKTYVNIEEPISPSVPAIVADRKAFYERFDDNSPTRSNSAATLPKSPKTIDTRHVITIQNNSSNQSSSINGNTPTSKHVTDSSMLSYVPNASEKRPPTVAMVAKSQQFDRSPDQSKVTHHHVVKTRYEQKTITSFSKDLNSAPNNFPEMVHVTRTIRNGASPSMSAFDAVRFSIGPDAEVVPKKKY